MRAGLLTLVVLVATASAAPRKPRHYHLHAHERRADAVEVKTDVVVVTATAAGAVVYLDGYGNPTSTAYQGQQAAAPTPAAQSSANAAPKPPSYQSPQKSPPGYTPAAQSPTADAAGGYNGPSSTPEQQAPPSTPSPAASSPAANSPASSDNSNGTIPSGRGVTYTPYNDDGSVKTQDQVTSDLASIDGYSTVRIYDTSDNQVAMLIQAAKPKGMKVFVGFTNPKDVQSQTQAIIDDAKNDWDSIHTVAVGNEAVSAGLTDVAGAVSALNTARSMLRAAGFDGPVVTVENNAMLLESSNAPLCKNSDYTAANVHPWFNQDTSSDEAGTFVQNTVQQIANNCGTDPSNVVVTETGWPWQGQSHGTNNKMVASASDQKTAISAIQSKFSDNVIFLSAFDELWKSPGEYNCEHYWGILKHNT